MFDDRADVFCMICDRLMELRAQEALTLEEKPVTDFKDALGRFRGQSEEDAEKSFEGTKRRDKIKNIEDILRKKLQELGRI